MTNALEAYIIAENEANRVRMEREEGLYIGTMVSDPEHWAQYGITTVEQYLHYCAVEDYRCMYKGIHGFSPRWMDFDAMSVEDIEDEMDFLHRCAIAEEREAKAEHEAEVARMIELGAGDRETAERWMADAEGRA